MCTRRRSVRRSTPDSVLRWRRHGIAVISKYRSRGRWRGGRLRIAVQTRQLIREMGRANFLWDAPRIHSELLKLGITLSQATVLRYMLPSSRNDRPSQGCRTFVRNHAITIVQTRCFNGRSRAGDPLSQVRSRLRGLAHHLVALVAATVAGTSCWTVWHMVRPILVVVPHGQVWFIQPLTLAADFMAPPCRYPSVVRRVDVLMTGRIRWSPTAKELKRHADSDRSPMRSTGKRTPSNRRHSAASSINCHYSQTARIVTRAGAPIPYSEPTRRGFYPE
jgi:hypothetical protein